MMLAEDTQAMEWTVAVFGELSFPRGGVEAWKVLEVDASRYDDWVEEFEGGGLDPAPVHEVLDEIRAFRAPPEGPGKLRISVNSRGVSVVGVLEDDGYRAWCAHVATLFRVADGAGASGEITFVHVGGAYGYRVEVKPGASSFTAVNDRPKIDRMRSQDAFATVLGLLGRKPVKTTVDQAPSRADDPRYGAIVTLLEKVPAATINAALEARGGVRDPATQKDLRRADDALALLRSGPTEGHRVFAANLARELDPKGFEPIAVDLITEGTDLALANAAVWALRRSKHPRALEALLVALADPRADASSLPGHYAFEALSERLGPALGEVLHATLTPAFAAGANATVVARIVQLLRQSGLEIPADTLAAVTDRKDTIIHNALATPLAKAPSKPAAKKKSAAKKKAAKRSASNKTPAKKAAALKARSKAR
jgi:hypothetical protein